ncbi:serine acetyltransferase [Sphingobium phenoxybenzoativorans]|uniref:Serine acetyltransferase n=1 Tax=Sphingobium phenoxybenzoativorans TaxID=1592790 RepID=A0A975Q096_9SPHN|nr:serine acetyltransferase [Sphingobium phenoxybenzoativorans]QUT04077.1 serine acetyltransferase [Sphingobium phenoxybenzoativorans]
MNEHDKAWQLKERLAKMPRTGLLKRFRFRFVRRLYTLAQNRLGFYIPFETPFETKPYFPHGLHGVFVSKRATVGAHCVIFHHVTIGANTSIDSKGLGAPVIGDRCYIGVGAKIIGNVRIGNDVRIGANAVVTRDVPDRGTVIGVNDIRVSERQPDNRYFSRSPKGWLAHNGETAVPVPPEYVERLEAAFPRAF